MDDKTLDEIEDTKEEALKENKEPMGTPVTVRDPNTGKLVVDEKLIDRKEDSDE